MEFTYYKIYFLKYAVLCFFVCTHGYISNSTARHHSKKKLLTLESLRISLLALLSPAIINVLSVCLYFAFLNISYKLNHAICGPLWLAIFTQHNVLRFIQVCSMNWYFISFSPFCGYITFCFSGVGHLCCSSFLLLQVMLL